MNSSIALERQGQICREAVENGQGPLFDRGRTIVGYQSAVHDRPSRVGNRYLCPKRDGDRHCAGDSIRPADVASYVLDPILNESSNGRPTTVKTASLVSLTVVIVLLTLTRTSVDRRPGTFQVCVPSFLVEETMV